MRIDLFPCNQYTYTKCVDLVKKPVVSMSRLKRSVNATEVLNLGPTIN
jgi:hypothetical protein